MQSKNGDLTSGMLDAAVQLMGREGRRGMVRVEGLSMAPMLVAGQVLGVEFSPAKLRRGDLLLFRQADYLAVHRLLGRAKFSDGSLCLRTRGDAVPRLDPPVDASKVVGRVVAVQGKDGWRDARNRRARAYAFALALHDLSWAAAVALAERCDRHLRRRGWRYKFRPKVAALDRWLLRWIHRMLFRACHRRIPPPEFPHNAGNGS